MRDYRELLDIAYIDHSSNLAYRSEYLACFGSEFDLISVVGKDGDLEYGRRLQIGACTKKYCMLTDADDLFVPKNIKHLVDYLEKDTTIAAAVGWDVVFRDEPPAVHIKAEWIPTILSVNHTRSSPLVMHNAVVWRTATLKRFMSELPTGFSKTKNFDFDFKNAFLAEGHLVVKYPEIVTYYRDRKDGENYLGKYCKRIR